MGSRSLFYAEDGDFRPFRGWKVNNEPLYTDKAKEVGSGHGKGTTPPAPGTPYRTPYHLCRCGSVGPSSASSHQPPPPLGSWSFPSSLHYSAWGGGVVVPSCFCVPLPPGLTFSGTGRVSVSQGRASWAEEKAWCMMSCLGSPSLQNTRLAC